MRRERGETVVAASRAKEQQERLARRRLRRRVAEPLGRPDRLTVDAQDRVPWMDGTVALGKREIEDDEVVVALERTGEGGLAVVHDVDCVALRVQPPLEEARDLLLVLDDQDAHAHPRTLTRVPRA